MNDCLAWWGKRRWFFLWLPGNRSFNIHSSRNCHRLSFQIGPLGFRWVW